MRESRKPSIAIEPRPRVLTAPFRYLCLPNSIEILLTLAQKNP